MSNKTKTQALKLNLTIAATEIYDAKGNKIGYIATQMQLLATQHRLGITVFPYPGMPLVSAQVEGQQDAPFAGPQQVVLFDREATGKAIPLNDNVVTQQIDNETIFFALDTGRLVRLSGIPKAIQAKNPNLIGREVVNATWLQGKTVQNVVVTGNQNLLVQTDKGMFLVQGDIMRAQPVNIDQVRGRVITGFAYDQTDGNVIVNTRDAQGNFQAFKVYDTETVYATAVTYQVGDATVPMPRPSQAQTSQRPS